MLYSSLGYSGFNQGCHQKVVYSLNQLTRLWCYAAVYSLLRLAFFLVAMCARLCPLLFQEIIHLGFNHSLSFITFSHLIYAVLNCYLSMHSLSFRAVRTGRHQKLEEPKWGLLWHLKNEVRFVDQTSISLDKELCERQQAGVASEAENAFILGTPFTWPYCEDFHLNLACLPSSCNSF